MRGGSPPAETDHAWAAAAHISPLCKVAGPPMINSTGEQNGGNGSGCHRPVYHTLRLVPDVDVLTRRHHGHPF